MFLVLSFFTFFCTAIFFLFPFIRTFQNSIHHNSVSFSYEDKFIFIIIHYSINTFYYVLKFRQTLLHIINDIIQRASALFSSFFYSNANDIIIFYGFCRILFYIWLMLYHFYLVTSLVYCREQFAKSHF